ncbi:uncharacterized protein BX663DRAFT_554328 [Cokeromyces recurvatus]|uniref:uncharacterized protein n=1 Tax=Cokeromyces recurvatus TaxID=90255 RepID=UPI00221FFE3A|nr:uncharacterized protein BX663DRAFT_564179 [Cokeromyces recurvatus]XP_051380136.1 uncharacterized protein BX663DRAFT_554328 [Cokeromyces recurvatus]KAI7899133.1 hypothetical protein BX663DRAFT_564179 [Cokeromyces recurvatus]KAI7900151.1 hypothetical protein BX663DRAFT_554328 [Cokeromyces recurvatus]
MVNMTINGGKKIKRRSAKFSQDAAKVPLIVFGAGMFGKDGVNLKGNKCGATGVLLRAIKRREKEELTSQPPEPRSPQPTITTKWKRVFEEGLQLLEDEYVTKKARLNELGSRIKEIMEERQGILVEIEDFEKKKKLTKEIIS